MGKHTKYSPRLLPNDPNLPEIGLTLVAKMLGINESTLDIWCREGRVIPTATTGKTKKWSLNDLEKLRERLLYK